MTDCPCELWGKARRSRTLPHTDKLSWNIYLATSTPAKFVGTVEAPDSDVAKAIEEFHIEPARKGCSSR